MKQKFKSTRVAILGKPNAGKSTLLNSLIEAPLSGTSNRPQTTRNNIRGIIQRYDESKDWVGQIVLVDTPGVNLSRGLLERSMHIAVNEALEDIDTVIWVADARAFRRDLNDVELDKSGQDKVMGWLVEQMESQKDKQWILCLNKVDLMRKNDLLPMISDAQKLMGGFSEIIPVSALKGIKDRSSNLEDLLETLDHYAKLDEIFFDESAWTDLNDRQLLTNLVREALFRQLRKEVPYETDCSLYSYKEPTGKKKLPEVDAYIWVARESLKPIVVGKNAERIKGINQLVRQRFKEITGQEIVLRLRVKVLNKWGQSPEKVRELGYVTG